MFHKDTFRLIRKTRKRFVTILLIVLIGVGFMVGLMCSAPTMRASVDKYFDEYSFMDIQLYSSYGFDDRDIEALNKSENIDELFATKFTDVFVRNDESTIVTRVQETDSPVNRFTLVDGRMPQKENEALALGSSEASFGSVFRIGDKVELYLEDSDLSESLSVCEYEIVGIVRTPQYMASSRETSTLDNLSLSTVIFVDNNNFINEYYTSVYLTFKNSKNYNSFNKDYEQFIQDNLDQLEDIIDKQEVIRRDEIIEEITVEIEDGEKKLNEEIAKAQAEIDDGMKQLEDAKVQLLVGEAQITANKSQITSGEQEIAASEKLLADSEAQIAAAKKQIENQTGMSFDDAVISIKSAYGVYTMVNSLVNSGQIPPDSTLDDSIAENNKKIAELTEKNASLAADNITLNTENASLRVENLNLQSMNSALESENKMLELSGSMFADKIAENNARIQSNNETIKNNETKIATNEAVVSQNNTVISANNTEISELSAENLKLEQLKPSLGDGIISAIPEMINEMFGGDITQVYNGVIQLESGLTEIESGKKQLAAAKVELEAGKQQLAAAESQIASGRAEYEKGLKELADAQKTLDEEYEKGRIELEKAKQQLDELPDAEWTVLDRDYHYSTAMFEGNADQMQRIGNVFPMLFCLVAALVCMTTMKRLVDEERSQIGVFSALGFSKAKIISKYIIYALGASLIGSGIGIPIGVLALPWVIYTCWKMMYDLPDMLLTLPLSIGVLGVCLFTFLMVWVTFTVVRGVLKECPSQLMRPKAPKTAKKVFLEKIPFIWKRLSFTSKVTARNIIRYKSRFFMTVIGVAGCTSLLVLGFAIKGSISQVITLQFGDIINHDTVITLEDDDCLGDIHSEVLDHGNVEYAAPYMSYSAMGYTDEGEKAIQAYIMESSDILNVYNLRDRKTKLPMEPDDGAIISEKYADMYNIGVGDELVIESSNGIKKAVKIDGICEMYTQHYLFMSRKGYEKLFNETVHYDNIAVKTDNSTAVVNSFKDKDGIKTVTDFTDTISTFSSMLDTLDIIVIVIIIAAGSLALVVIMNLTEVNISERIREIATLKVLGFNNKEVYSYIFKEVFLLSLIGMVIGLPLGKLELIFVMDIIEMEMVMFSTVIEPLSYIFGFIIIMIFTIMVIYLFVA